MERPELRSYQKQAIERVFKSFESNNSVMLQMPTGTGKTVVFTELVKRWLDTKGIGKRVLFVVHRSELVDQIMGHLSSLGIASHRIQGKIDKENLINFRVHVGTVQTLQNPDKLPENLSLIVIDEAHHTPAMSYRRIIDSYSKVNTLKVLGVTATPQRLSGENFSDLFDDLILSEPIKKFQELGFLSPTRHFVTSLPNLSELQLKMNDYDEGASEKLMLREDIMADLVDSYQQYAQGKKAIVFAVSVKHSMEIAKRFLAIGIKSAHIDGKTPAESRKNIVEKFKRGEIQILSNVNVFTEGFDCPDVEVVQLARPTKSLVMYLQMVGRVMRPFEGKQYGLILDNARLWQDHGLSNQKFNWNWQGNELNPEKKKLSAVKNEGEAIQKIKVKELKGLELVEVSDHSNFDFEEEERTETLSRETLKLQNDSSTGVRESLIKFQNKTLSQDFTYFKESISVRIRLNESYGFKIIIHSNNKTKVIHRFSRRDSALIIDERIFDFQEIYWELIDGITKMIYNTAFSANRKKRYKHDFVIRYGSLELKLLNISNQFFLEKDNYLLMKEYRSSIANIDFSLPRPKMGASPLKLIHAQFEDFEKFLFFATHKHDLQ